VSEQERQALSKPRLEANVFMAFVAGVCVGITSFLLKESVSLIYGYRQHLIAQYVPAVRDGPTGERGPRVEAQGVLIKG
jgi:hypothetical protein